MHIYKTKKINIGTSRRMDTRAMTPIRGLSLHRLMSSLIYLNHRKMW